MSSKMCGAWGQLKPFKLSLCAGKNYTKIENEWQELGISFLEINSLWGIRIFYFHTDALHQ